MLLIQSDMFKSIWLMAYPLLTFSMGPVASNSTFCQAQGFLLAVGIEAAGSGPEALFIHVRSANTLYFRLCGLDDRPSYSPVRIQL